jgi:hypothetical protein
LRACCGAFAKEASQLGVAGLQALKLQPLPGHCQLLLGDVLLLLHGGGFGRADLASHLAKRFAKRTGLRWGQETLRHGQHDGVEHSILADVQRLRESGQRFLIAPVGLYDVGIFAR